MKKIVQYIVAPALVIGIWAGCKKLDSTYKDFIVPGGLTYAGKVSKPAVYAGNHRIKISWLRGSDPNVVKARVFWNNGNDSVEVAIPPVGDVISVTLNNLEERTYSFVVKTYDSNGNSSIPVELFGGSYGEKFQAGIQSLNRPVRSTTLLGDGSFVIDWGTANKSGGAYATEVKYTDKTDNKKIKQVPVDEEKSILNGIKPGTTFEYRTLYLPDTLSIDTFYTDIETIKQFLFDKVTWSVVSFSSQHNTAAENVATNFIDGNPGTRWHCKTDQKYPHFIVVDMKSEKTVTGFELFRMTGDDRACDKFQLLLSPDNVTWTDLGTFDFNRLKDDGQFYNIASRPKGRYIKFVGVAGVSPYMVSGEMNVYGL